MRSQILAGKVENTKAFLRDTLTWSRPFLLGESFYDSNLERIARDYGLEGIDGVIIFE